MKKYKTGDIIEIAKKEMAVIDTFVKGKDELDTMLAVLARKYHAVERKFWNTIYDLYPEAKGFDLHANWKKGEITLRGKREE